MRREEEARKDFKRIVGFGRGIIWRFVVSAVSAVIVAIILASIVELTIGLGSGRIDLIILSISSFTFFALFIKLISQNPKN